MYQTREMQCIIFSPLPNIKNIDILFLFFKECHTISKYNNAIMYSTILHLMNIQIMSSFLWLVIFSK